MRWVSWSILLFLIGAIGFFGFLPGRAQTMNIRIWPAEQTPKSFAEAMEESGWSPVEGRCYYFVTSLVGFRSLLPIGIDDLQVKVADTLPGVRVHRIPPQFPRQSGRFEKLFLETALLVEAPGHLDLDALALGFQFVVVSGDGPWPGVQVTTRPGIAVLHERDFIR